jgi:hypothetical protein
MGETHAFVAIIFFGSNPPLVGLNIQYISWAVYRTIFRIIAGFWSKFYSNGRLSECRNKLFEEGHWIFIITVFKEVCKNLAFDFLSNKDQQIKKNTSAYTESGTDLTL